MTYVCIFAGIAVILFVVCLVLGKLGSDKGRTGMIALGIASGFLAFVSGFFGYESYMILPVEYNVINYREVEDGYQLTLEGTVKGLTGGTVTIAEYEAKTLGLLTEDDEGHIEWCGGVIKENRRWVSDHRS